MVFAMCIFTCLRFRCSCTGFTCRYWPRTSRSDNSFLTVTNFTTCTSRECVRWRFFLAVMNWHLSFQIKTSLKIWWLRTLATRKNKLRFLARSYLEVFVWKLSEANKPCGSVLCETLQKRKLRNDSLSLCCLSSQITHGYQQKCYLFNPKHG